MLFKIMSGRFVHSVLVGLVCLAIVSCSSSVGSSNNTILCLESERHALLQFKQGLVDESNALASWESKRDCCEWRGIACNNHTGHVISLDLSISHLRGEIHPSLLELQNLNYLDLSDNDFGGMMIPKFIGSLSQLKVLKLAEAHFNGPVPPHLGNLSNLHTLDLSYQDVRSENLEWLSHLSSVRYLNMSGVDLSEAVNWPQSLSKLTSLRELQLSSCDLPDVILSSLSFINSSTSLQFLDLSYNSLNSSIIHWIGNVSTNFVYVDLSDNNLEGPIPDAFTSMLSLETLDLSYNQLEGGIPKGFQNLCNLQSLSLAENLLSGNIEDSLKSLSCSENTLESLSLGFNLFWGSFPDLKRFSELRWLDISFNQLNGSLPESVGQLSRLEALYLSNNSFTGVITESHFHKLSRLLSLQLSGNRVTLNLSSDWNPPFQLTYDLGLSSNKLGPAFPKWILTQSNLTGLFLSNCGLAGSLPNEFWDIFSAGLSQLDLSMNQLDGNLPNLSATSLVLVSLSSNLLSGAVPSFSPNLLGLDLSNNMLSEPSSSFCATPAPYLSMIDISNNLLSGVLPDCWMQFQSLVALNLENNSLSGIIPSSLGSLTKLQTLSLNSNNFSGELPSLENCTELLMVDLDSNNLSGKIPSSLGSLTKLQALSLNSNNFSGELPSLENCTELSTVDLGSNNLSGKIPSSLGSLTKLQVLSLNGNNFSGELPSLENCTELFMVDLDSNNLSGKIPSSLGNLTRLMRLRLSGNNFSGELPSLENCTELLMVDLGRNNLSGKIPAWIGQSLSKLVILRLRSNEFNGIIPSSLCGLGIIHVLDLSHNNITGPLPHCFYNITALADDSPSAFMVVEIVWKRIEIEFGNNLWHLRSIDISSNSLVGEIPESIIRMQNLISLNLSRNRLAGNLPENFGNMNKLESLDLSRNQISGQIPSSFSRMNFLEVLDLSHNQLSGRIPTGTQLQSFEASAYMGNLGLCGPPLTPNCAGDETTTQDGQNKEHDDDDGHKISLGIIVSSVLGFITGFWVVCGSLMLKSSWRYAYFEFLDNAKDWIYVKVEVYRAKMQRLRR